MKLFMALSHYRAFYDYYKMVWVKKNDQVLRYVYLSWLTFIERCFALDILLTSI